MLITPKISGGKDHLDVTSLNFGVTSPCLRFLFAFLYKNNPWALFWAGFRCDEPSPLVVCVYIAITVTYPYSQDAAKPQTKNRNQGTKF